MRQTLTDAELRMLEKLTKDQAEQKEALIKASAARAEVCSLSIPRTLANDRSLLKKRNSRLNLPRVIVDEDRNYERDWMN